MVIYGMGNGADKVIDELERLDIEIKGVTASDDFVRGQSFRGFTVKKLSEFEGEFIIAVAFASCLPDVMNHIFSLTEKYRVLVPVVPVYGNAVFNRAFVEEHETELEKAYSLFSDNSKKIFEGCVDFMFGGELEKLRAITTEKDEAFENILKLGENEDYLDLGAYKGDTIEEFLHYSGGKYSSITALEPDAKTFKKLCANTERLESFTAINKAVYSNSDGIFFDSAAGRQSSVSAKGKFIPSVSVDDLCRKFSYIKADVEGSEREAILGAEKTLSEYRPKLNIALYHRSEDIFFLPLLIHGINSDYRFELRRHPYIPCWDMNLYCI